MSGPQPDEPNYYLLIAPGELSDATAPDWVDASTYLRSLTITRGADKNLDEDQPGALTVELDNYSGVWDNENSQSVWAGLLVPDMQVRILAEWDGDLEERFNGYLDDITLTYPEEGEAWATLRATDAFKVLAGAELPSSAYVAEVMADNPVAFWRLDEDEGSTVVFDDLHDYPLTFTGAAELGDIGLISREPGTAMTVDDPNEGAIGDAVLTSSPLSIEVVYRWQSTTVDAFITGVFSDVSAHGAFIGVRGSTGALIMFGSNGSGLTSTLTTGVDVRDGGTYHLLLTWGSDNNVNLYVNGTLRAGPVSITAGAFSGGESLKTIIAGGPAAEFATIGAKGTYQGVAFYTSGLSATRAEEHALTVATPWEFDIPSQRAHRICDVIGWPEERRDFEEGLGQTTLQSATLGMSALEHLLKVAASEFGELHVTKDGTIKLVARHSLINRDQLADFGSDATQYRDVTFASGADLVRNPVTVSRLEGKAQTVAATATYYPHHYTIDGLYHSDDELSLAAANFLVSEFKDQKRRIVSLDFGPFEAERLYDWFPLLLEAELGDVYQVTFTPPNGDPIVQVSVLEGTEETWSAQEGVGSIRWTLSQAYAGGGSFWQLGVTGRSELGDTTRLFF